jgi:undecaprenyl-diphosphatase
VEYVSRGAFAFGTVVVVIAGLVWLARNRPGLFRTLADRLTPGELRLELTTMLALLAVGAFAFFFVGAEVGDGGAVGIDRMAADAAERLRTPALVDLGSVLTDVGSLPVVAFVALVTALWATGQGRWLDGLAVALAMTLSIIVVYVAKAAYDRPRPADGLVNATNFAYPSGHSLYAVGLVACAVVLVRGGMGWARRFAAVGVAMGIAALVGVTRVYLGVHYLTDVLGGFAAGVAIWSVVGALAVVGGHVRHNEVRR